ncbi:hypothetical protein B0A49_00048 [Cryomyces minteri]|uniref:Xylanolytic transcriptional activator regulatory domain-containing protein n=1 Tax=Cryomyces minteri TaxID=331657 RepID=A0A4V5NIK4_9PEZI|nr:hypothetical protein B0A49_00048 [Cryomyces minteri]
MDRYLSVMLGRPRIFHDEDIDQEYPERVNDDDMTTTGISSKPKGDDCVMDAPVLHAQLARIIGEISKEVHTLRTVPEDEWIEATQKRTRDLQRWREQLPPILGAVRASSLIPIFQRQNTVLRLAYAHAIILANRPFLLSNFADLARRPGSKHQKFRENIQECVKAAKMVVKVVNQIAEDGMLFQVFWFTQYISFCAVAVLYIYTIQQHQSEAIAMTPSTVEGDGEDCFDLAQRCQRSIAGATRQNSPSRRCSLILEELRLEVFRQVRRAGTGGLLLENRPVEAAADGSSSTQNQVLVDHFTHLSDGSVFPEDFGSFSAELLAPEIVENWGMMGWAQLDSWAFSNNSEDQGMGSWQFP